MKKNSRKRVSVIVKSEGHILGFHAQDPHNKKEYFFLPGGQIEEGESLIDTAIRETLEETGYSIKITNEFSEFRKYEFEWNNEINICETWYFEGELMGKMQAPIDDASYHKGMCWLPMDQIKEKLSYHKDILEPALAVIG